jgi:rod shape determining protein RodA
MKDSVFLRMDWVSLLLYLFLVGFGLVNIYSATYLEGAQSLMSLSTPFGKQLLFMGLSFLGGGFLLALRVKFFEQFSTPIYISAMLLLVGLFFFGKTISGARSWYAIGGFGLQPAEFAKMATALLLSKVISQFQTNLKSIRSLFKLAGIISLPALLIVLQPDPGSALVFGAFFFVLFREGLNYIFLIILSSALILFVLTLVFAIPVVISLVIVLLSLLFYLFKRMRYTPPVLPFILSGIMATGFIFSVDFIFNEIFEQRHRDRFNIILGKEVDTQGVGYNINQSKIAIGSGGFQGKGFLKGTQTKGDFVPEQHTDYIFSIIGEEWGFLGSILVIGCFAALIIRILWQAEKQTNQFRRVFSYSVSSILFVHFLINIGMSLGLIPTIGIPLLLVSYGGSSLLATSLMFFTYLNMDANRLRDW